MAVSQNRFAPELNEKQVAEILEDLSVILRAFLIKQLFHLRLLVIVQYIEHSESDQSNPKLYIYI